ncbi:MAG: outer membrane protein assembly factor, partial [Mangrovimonas sp.]|nr:outer membrane protein assembly factor [Mangrovimonas sp.]
MRSRFSKIILFLLTIGAFLSCNSVKRVAEEDHLLTKNTIKVNGEVEKSEEVNNLLTLRPNTKALSLPIRLYIYNLARPNIDSILNQKVYADSSKLARKTWLYSRKQVDKDVEKRKNFNAWLKRTGEAPVIINE